MSQNLDELRAEADALGLVVALPDGTVLGGNGEGNAGLWVRFTPEGIPGWFGPEPVEGAVFVEGVPAETLITHRRDENGEWILRDPVKVTPPTAEQIEADGEATFQAAVAARDGAIDAAITASDAYRSFLRGGMTLTAYRTAASDIAVQFPMPVR